MTEKNSLVRKIRMYEDYAESEDFLLEDTDRRKYRSIADRLKRLHLVQFGEEYRR